MTESEKVQYTIDTGMSTYICIPGKIDLKSFTDTFLTMKVRSHISQYFGEMPKM